MKKTILKIPRIKKVRVPSSQMDKKELLQMEMDLKELIYSKGWIRFVSILENDFLPLLDDKIDNAIFTDITEFNRVRDTRQVYRKIIQLPKTYVTMLQKSGVTMELDPYDDVPKKKT